jgi:hypothetical protein
MKSVFKRFAVASWSSRPFWIFSNSRFFTSTLADSPVIWSSRPSISACFFSIASLLNLIFLLYLECDIISSAFQARFRFPFDSYSYLSL